MDPSASTLGFINLQICSKNQEFRTSDEIEYHII